MTPPSDPPLSDLPTNIDFEYFSQKSVSMGSFLYIYVNWVEKLQEAGRPVVQWLNRIFLQFQYLHTIDLTYLGKENRIQISQIHWPKRWERGYRDIAQLNIQRSIIDHLPKWVFTMPNLCRLYIYEKNDSYTKIPFQIRADLARLRSLRELSISNTKNFSYQFDPDFCRNNHIYTLHLDMDGLQPPFTHLGLFPYLEELHIYSSTPQADYSFLASLSYLKRLYFCTHLDHLPEEMQHLSALEELDLMWNPLTYLPAWIVTLHRLKSLILNHPLTEGPINSFIYKTDHILITEFPPELHACPSLLFCKLGIVTHSLHNLPPLAQYWAAVSFAYSHGQNDLFDLPNIVRETVKAEFAPSFIIHTNSALTRLSESHLQEKMGHFTVGYDFHDFDTFMKDGILELCILCHYRFPPHFNSGICPACGIDNRIGPTNHPHLIEFLEHFYAESYESLFDRVRNGGKLSRFEIERFMHETTYQTYQLLFNTAQVPLDHTILDALTRKFSVELNSSTRILL